MSMMTLFSCTMRASFVAGNHWVWSGVRLVCAVSCPIKATAIPPGCRTPPTPPPPRYDSWFQILEDNKKKEIFKKKFMFPYIF